MGSDTAVDSSARPPPLRTAERWG
ncbi:hypothetical protein E4K73_18450 [Streptomyces sp. IB201691-2A2]|nr:hypothetical protein E4K73_18450 [Streptomyces sp. IB201691-2A2]